MDQSLDSHELNRFSRQISLPEIGAEGQLRLRRARVLIVGAGGLGSPIALYLAAAGVGTLGLADFDEVDASNLQRQILYGETDVGRTKLAAAGERLRAMNGSTRVVPHLVRLTVENAPSLIEGYDLVIDGTDNFDTRYALNDACVRAGRILIYGSISRFAGMLSVVAPGAGPCYRCLFPLPPPAESVPDCATGGVLGVVPGILGTLMANEALKLVLGIGEPLMGRVLWVEALAARFREVRLDRDPACPVCSAAPAPSAEPARRRVVEVTASELPRALERGALLIDVREAGEVASETIAGARHIALPELASRCAELDPTREIVVYCRSGARSARAALLLAERGFERVASLRGGIIAYKSLYSLS